MRQIPKVRNNLSLAFTFAFSVLNHAFTRISEKAPGSVQQYTSSQQEKAGVTTHVLAIVILLLFLGTFMHLFHLVSQLEM